MRAYSVRRHAAGACLLVAAAASACGAPTPSDRVRISGQIEATEVQVAALVGGRLLELTPDEGDHVAAGELVARLDATDAELALARARAERDQADAQLRLLRAGSRVEDIRQADAQLATAQSDARAADAEVVVAEADASRFEALLESKAGTQKQRDDAAARRDVARARARSAEDRVRAAQQNLARLRAGARPEEIDAARARVAAADAQIATLQKAITDAVVTTPVAGIVTERLVDVGELVQPRAPILIVTNLDQVWANVYVDEPTVPRLKIGQQATLFTDAGGPGMLGVISYVSRSAEFTPRNVQTAEDRSKLVYRVKVTVDNKDGVLKAGMPVEAEIPIAP
jgi:HlyD family secretion protein